MSMDIDELQQERTKKIDDLDAKIAALRAQRRELKYSATSPAETARQRTYAMKKNDLLALFKGQAQKLGCTFKQITPYVFAFVDKNGSETRFAIRNSKDWINNVPSRQQTLLAMRSWHTISPERLQSMHGQVDKVAFAISSRATGKATVFAVPLTWVEQHINNPKRRYDGSYNFYFGVTKDGQVIENRLNQTDPIYIDIQPNNWDTLKPQSKN